MLTVSTPMHGVMHVLFDTRLEMNLTMCRFQEYYESPHARIKGQFFTLEEFITAYAKPDGSIDYFSYWEGFNIPARVLTETMCYFHGEREKMLVSLWKVAGRPQYVIATDKSSDPTTLDHELCHARMSLDREYNSKVMLSLEDLPRDFFKDLLAGEYPDDYKILCDEVNAYLLTSTEQELEETFPSISKEVRDVWKAKLQALQ